MLVEIKAFVNWIRRRNPDARTWRDYGYDLAQFVAVVGDVSPATVTFHAVDRFVTQQADRGYQPATINRRLAAITSLYTFLADEDPTLVCPVLPHRHQLRQRQRLPRPVPAADLQRFFAVIHDTRDRAMFLLMLRCGLRISEVARLQLVDLYLDEALPRLLVRGKGGKERAAYLSPQAEQALRRYLDARPQAASDYVFLSYQLDGLSTTAIHKRLMRYRALAEVNITAHQLRHTFANDLVGADVPVTTIQKLLGHAWLETTQTYVAANDRQVQADFYAASAQVGGLAMNTPPALKNAASRYDAALRHAHARHQPHDYPVPEPTATWPPENVALLERYLAWLLSGGISHSTIAQLYIPMAGHALGLNLKPHPQLDLDTDLERALDYIKAKHLSAEWTDMCRVGLEKFRHFLRQERGCVAVALPTVNHERYCAGLPSWLIQHLTRYQHVLQRNWRPARLQEQHHPLLEWSHAHLAVAGGTRHPQRGRRNHG